MVVKLFGQTFRPRRYKAGLVAYICWKTGDYTERHQYNLYRMPIGTVEKIVLSIKTFDKEKGEVPAGGSKYRRYLLNLRIAFVLTGQKVRV